MAGSEASNEEFVRLWTKAQPSVAAFVSSIIPDFHRAEDVLQRCAAALIRKFDHYDPSQPFIAWAIGVARFEVLVERRRVASDRLVFDDAAVENVANAYQRIEPEVNGMVESLQKCLDRLNSKARQLVDLRYGADLKPREIATRLGSTVNATTVALNRVRESLRNCMDTRLAAKKAAP